MKPAITRRTSTRITHNIFARCEIALVTCGERVGAPVFIVFVDGAELATERVSAPNGFTVPNPKKVSNPRGPVSVAVDVIRLTTSVDDRAGSFDRINAATPDTIAAAIDVPLAST